MKDRERGKRGSGNQNGHFLFIVSIILVALSKWQCRAGLMDLTSRASEVGVFFVVWCADCWACSCSPKELIYLTLNTAPVFVFIFHFQIQQEKVSTEDPARTLFYAVATEG